MGCRVVIPACQSPPCCQRDGEDEVSQQRFPTALPAACTKPCCCALHPLPRVAPWGRPGRDAGSLDIRPSGGVRASAGCFQGLLVICHAAEKGKYCSVPLLSSEQDVSRPLCGGCWSQRTIPRPVLSQSGVLSLDHQLLCGVWFKLHMNYP